MRTSWTPAWLIASTSGSSSSVFFLTTILLVAGSRTSSATVRPRMRLPSEADHLARVDDGAHLDAGRGAAVLRGDDAVLRHVDQAAREVAGVRRLQRGVGEALAGAVGRVEVLEHREPFLEVGDDRALDDLARRLRHQAAHAGELAHLRRRAARAGMRHHVDRVDRHLALAVRHSSAPRKSRASSRRRSARWTWTRHRPPCCTSRPG